MVCLQLAIVILKALSKKFAMMQLESACAKKVFGEPDATNASQDGLIIPTANLANALKKDLPRKFAMPKREIVLVIPIMQVENVNSVPWDTLAIPNATLANATPMDPRANPAMIPANATARQISPA